MQHPRRHGRSPRQLAAIHHHTGSTSPRPVVITPSPAYGQNDVAAPWDDLNVPDSLSPGMAVSGISRSSLASDLSDTLLHTHTNKHAHSLPPASHLSNHVYAKNCSVELHGVGIGPTVSLEAQVIRELPIRHLDHSSDAEHSNLTGILSAHSMIVPADDASDCLRSVALSRGTVSEAASEGTVSRQLPSIFRNNNNNNSNNNNCSPHNNSSATKSSRLPAPIGLLQIGGHGLGAFRVDPTKPPLSSPPLSSPPLSSPPHTAGSASATLAVVSTAMAAAASPRLIAMTVTHPPTIRLQPPSPMAWKVLDAVPQLRHTGTLTASTKPVAAAVHKLTATDSLAGGKAHFERKASPVRHSPRLQQTTYDGSLPPRSPRTWSMKAHPIPTLNGELIAAQRLTRHVKLQGHLLVEAACVQDCDVEELDLSGCSFDSDGVPAGYAGTIAFVQVSALTRLRKLDMRCTGLNHLPSIVRFTALRELDLSHNPLLAEDIKALVPTVADSLEALSIAACALTNLPPDIVLLKRCRRLDLSQNKLSSHCWPLLLAISSLESLSLSNNLIEDVTFPAPPAEPVLPSLRSLDLSRNRILTLDLGVFLRVPSLAYLDLSGNPFATSATAERLLDFHGASTFDDSYFESFAARNLQVVLSEPITEQFSHFPFDRKRLASPWAPPRGAKGNRDATGHRGAEALTSHRSARPGRRFTRQQRPTESHDAPLAAWDTSDAWGERSTFIVEDVEIPTELLNVHVDSARTHASELFIDAVRQLKSLVPLRHA